MTENSAVAGFFQETSVMAILRGLGVERSLAVATAAWELGIQIVEVPIQRAVDIEALRVVVDAGAARGLPVGAGTVLTRQHVNQASEAGAAFTVSPGLDLEVVRASHDAGMPSLPGVSTASEIQSAIKDGLSWLKVFPAVALGPKWFSAMRGPFPGVSFVASGGIDAANAPLFLAAGAPVVAVGSALEDATQLPAIAELLAQRDI
jgi:Entner-Doudoroff aldolase